MVTSASLRARFVLCEGGICGSPLRPTSGSPRRGPRRGDFFTGCAYFNRTSRHQTARESERVLRSSPSHFPHTLDLFSRTYVLARELRHREFRFRAPTLFFLSRLHFRHTTPRDALPEFVSSTLPQQRPRSPPSRQFSSLLFSQQ